MQAPGVDFIELDSDLPSYSQGADSGVSIGWRIPPLQTQHTYHLTKKTGEPWLSVMAVSRAASANHTPTFFQNGVIAGSLSVDLEKDDAIDSIEITLSGRLNRHNHSSSSFLNVPLTLWSSEDSSPTRSSKLVGKWEWPYTFRLPKGVNMVSHIGPSGGVRSNYRLPPSLTDPLSGVEIEYRLTVRVFRRRLRSASKLVIPISFTPLSRPGPPSILRQVAYSKETPLIGVEGDPRGWKTLPPVTVHGTLFKTVPVSLRYTLSLAQPMAYTRGTPLPLTMAVESTNAQALHLLSLNSAITCQLVQRTTFGGDTAEQLVVGPAQSKPSIDVKTRELCKAIWWPSAETPLLSNKTTLSGEIHIPEWTPLHCHILHFRVEHAIVFDTIQGVGFALDKSMKHPLLEERVEIATDYAPGPRPKPYMPPGYEGQRVPEEGRLSRLGAQVGRILTRSSDSSS